MSLRDLDRASVLCALEEYDAIGRDAFLKKYGFGPARNYILRHEEKEYDSKAIAGAAHGYLGPNEQPLTSVNFSGGEYTVQPILDQLGFTIEVKRPRNPSWTRDELILALEYYLDHLGRAHDKGQDGVIKLSGEINTVGRLLGHDGTETFRNPNGVVMKLFKLPVS